MRCIFCKQASSHSQSIEHIVPYTLGNRSYVLPRGIVCDGCNNYFSRKVERPFLESRAIRILRFHQELESRRGRVPPIEGVFWPDIPTTVVRDFKTGALSADFPIEAYDRLAAMERAMLLLPIGGDLPADPVISRFLAKVAVEAVALRLEGISDGIDYVCDEPQLNLIRDHARRGGKVSWPVHTRPIYNAGARSIGSNNEFEQILHEFDFLVTNKSEWYFVLAIFGLEMTINLGGPDIAGYKEWLSENFGASPLYSGKNNVFAMPIPI